MIAYILRRLLLLIPMAIGMVVVTFALLLIIPGDPVAVLLGQEATPDAIALLRANLGLDAPWYLRLWNYFVALAHGDMGQSIFQNQSVASIIGGRLAATIELAVVSLLLATVLGLLLGVISAIWQGSIIDTGTMLLAQIGVSMPVYWLGLLLMLLFAVNLGWLPAIGRGEPVSALDVSVQAQILNLLSDLQSELGVAFLFISHDLGVVEYLSDRVAVMYLGKIVEIADKKSIFATPAHPYTELLMRSAPSLDPRNRHQFSASNDDIPSATNKPSGCSFHTRCPLASDICRNTAPALTTRDNGRLLACHHR